MYYKGYLINNNLDNKKVNICVTDSILDLSDKKFYEAFLKLSVEDKRVLDTFFRQEKVGMQDVHSETVKVILNRLSSELSSMKSNILIYEKVNNGNNYYGKEIVSNLVFPILDNINATYRYLINATTPVWILNSDKRVGYLDTKKEKFIENKDGMPLIRKRNDSGFNTVYRRSGAKVGDITRDRMKEISLDMTINKLDKYNAYIVGNKETNIEELISYLAINKERDIERKYHELAIHDIKEKTLEREDNNYVIYLLDDLVNKIDTLSDNKMIYIKEIQDIYMDYSNLKSSLLIKPNSLEYQAILMRINHIYEIIDEEKKKIRRKELRLL